MNMSVVIVSPYEDDSIDVIDINMSIKIILPENDIDFQYNTGNISMIIYSLTDNMNHKYK